MRIPIGSKKVTLTNRISSNLDEYNAIRIAPDTRQGVAQGHAVREKGVATFAEG